MNSDSEQTDAGPGKDPLRIGAGFAFRAGLRLAATGLLALTLVSHLGSRSYLLDLLSHFRVQYAFGLFCVALAFGALKCWRWLAAALAGFLLNFSQVAPLYFGSHASAELERRDSIRLMSINVRMRNQEFDLVRRAIADNRPDVVLLIEVDRRWLAELDPLVKDYPHVIEEPRNDNFGIALWSRWPLENPEVIELSGRIPAIRCRVAVPGGALEVLGAHPVPPSGRRGSEERNAQLAELAERAKERDLPLVLIGDLNTTHWNHYFRRLQREAGLNNSAKGFGVQASWPASWGQKLSSRRNGDEPRSRQAGGWTIGSGLFRIPIDHCLVSTELFVNDRRLGPYTGSDHLPLVVDVGFAESP